VLADPVSNRLVGIVQTMKPALPIAIFSALLCCIATSEPLFTQKGTDPTFKELIDQQKLITGKNTTSGVMGSKIRVNRKIVENTPEAKTRIPEGIRIHTLANSAIARKGFDKWSRWYQEDGSTQIFRLFKDEVNVRNTRGNAARVEAFSQMSWKQGTWHEWSGTYTIIKPHGAAIFQAKNPVNDWSVQLNMDAEGNVKLNHRRGEDQLIAEKMTGRPFRIRVRDNGKDYEVYLNEKKVGQGSFERPDGAATHFRWGMYLGKSTVKHDAMIFVSGVEFGPVK
jgi:hypothetical protein